MLGQLDRRRKSCWHLRGLCSCKHWVLQRGQLVGLYFARRCIWQGVVSHAASFVASCLSPSAERSFGGVGRDVSRRSQHCSSGPWGSAQQLPCSGTPVKQPYGGKSHWPLQLNWAARSSTHTALHWLEKKLLRVPACKGAPTFTKLPVIFLVSVIVKFKSLSVH